MDIARWLIDLEARLDEVESRGERGQMPSTSPLTASALVENYVRRDWAGVPLDGIATLGSTWSPRGEEVDDRGEPLTAVRIWWWEGTLLDKVDDVRCDHQTSMHHLSGPELEYTTQTDPLPEKLRDQAARAALRWASLVAYTRVSEMRALLSLSYTSDRRAALRAQALEHTYDADRYMTRSFAWTELVEGSSS